MRNFIPTWRGGMFGGMKSGAWAGGLPLQLAA